MKRSGIRNIDKDIVKNWADVFKVKEKNSR